MNPLLQTLAQQLHDNIGNRLTSALCDGLMMAMNQAILAQEPKAKKRRQAKPVKEAEK